MQDSHNTNRRDFLKTGAKVASSIALVSIGANMLFADSTQRINHAQATDSTQTKGEIINTTQLPFRILGKDSAALRVSALGLGCMGMSANHGAPKPEKEMIKLLHEAYELGVTYFDTAEIYGPHTNEILLGKAFSDRRDKVVIGTKFGLYYPNGKQRQDSKPASIRAAVEGSLKRLKSEYIDIYTQHRGDPNTPIEEVAEVMQALIKEGKIRHYGLSEPAKTIERAHKVCPVTAIQSHYSMMTRNSESDGVFSMCEKLGIGFVAYSPIERGFISGTMDKNTTFDKKLDSRAHFPRFSKEALEANQVVIQLVREIAASKRVNDKPATPAQIALAWILAQKPYIMPISETTKLAHLQQNLGAVQISFSKQELGEINTALDKLKIVGERYPEGSDMAKSVGL